MNFAYLILAHKNPGQLGRLVKNLLSENIFVFIHIDNKTDEKPFRALLAGYDHVIFCKRRITVKWGGFSVVEATVSLMETMFANMEIPDYVHLLSGQDFPLKNQMQIASFFKQNMGRNFIELETLPRSGWYRGGMDRIEYDWFVDQLGYTKSKQLTDYQKPKSFLPEIIPCGGSQWWSLTGDCVAWLYCQCRDGNRLYDFYKHTFCADEMIFQTMLYDSPYKSSLINTNLKKLEWLDGGTKLHIWKYSDINVLKGTPKLFARKFDETVDSKVLEEVEDFLSQPLSIKNHPSVSVVMAMYNAEKYLKECIESVLCQTFADFEFIIVDDGSNDDSIPIAERYKDPRIKLIKNRHNHIESLNRAMAEAKGTFIARMDSDDIMLPERLEMQFDFMISHPHIDICATWVERFGLYKGIIKTSKENRQIVSGFLFANTIVNPSTFIRNESIKMNAIVYKKYRFVEDFKFWTDCAKAGLKFETIPCVLLKVRTTEESASSVHNSEMIRISNLVKHEYAEYLMNSMNEKDGTYSRLFEEIIHLANNKTVDISVLFNVLFKLNMKYD